MKRNQRRSKYIFEITIVGVIAVLLMILIRFSDTKLDELMASSNEALFLERDPDNPLHNELAEQILEFRPDACKMIEVYSDEFEPLVLLDFRDEGQVRDPLSEYPELMRLLENNESGHTTVTIDDIEEDVYFRWTSTNTGDVCLFIIYTSRPIVENFWVFHMICYTILGLVCILLMTLLMQNHNEKVRQYQELSEDVQNVYRELD